MLQWTVQSAANPRGGANLQKTVLSSDRRLQLACVKLESLVMAYQNDAVNTFPGLVHTARHITRKWIVLEVLIKQAQGMIH